MWVLFSVGAHYVRHWIVTDSCIYLSGDHLQSRNLFCCISLCMFHRPVRLLLFFFFFRSRYSKKVRLLFSILKFALTIFSWMLVLYSILSSIFYRLPRSKLFCLFRFHYKSLCIRMSFLHFSFFFWSGLLQLLQSPLTVKVARVTCFFIPHISFLSSLGCFLLDLSGFFLLQIVSY